MAAGPSSNSAGGVVVLLVALHLSLAVAAAQARDGCLATPKLLTSECGGVCEEYQPCVVYNASTECEHCVVDDDDVCSYFCVEFPESPTTFQVYVNFGAYESEEEKAARAVDRDYDSKVVDPGYQNDYGHMSNDNLTAIDTMELDPEGISFYLAGGYTYLPVYALKSKVAKVELAEDLISNQTQITTVYLVSLDLKATIGNLGDMLPSTVDTLHLVNNLLTEFPADIAARYSMRSLYLDANYITTIEPPTSYTMLQSLSLVENNIPVFPEAIAEMHVTNLFLDLNFIEVVGVMSASFSALTILTLANNSIHTFEATFPNLESLDLRYNNLTEIPASVFNHSRLEYLKIGGQKSQLSAEVTQQQLWFLQQLSSYDLTAEDFASIDDCAFDVQQLNDNISLCITDVAKSSSGTSSSSIADSIETGDNGSTSHTAVIVGVVVGAAVLGLFVLGLVILRRQRRRSMEQAALSAERDLGSASLWTDEELLSFQVKVDDIQDVKKIGGGAYGVVWLVKYRESQLLASKRLRKDEASRAYLKEFLNEIKLVAKFDHPNIVQFVGVAWTIENDLQALFEFMENGDLRDYLVARSDDRAWNPEKLRIAVGIIEGLVYVHSFVPPVVHRDLKSRNVLLSSDMEAKLTDFGVSRLKSENNTMTQGVGTGRWLAPEILHGSKDYDQAVDIFSFGVVLSELDTHEIPYDDARGSNGNKLADVAIMQRITEGLLRPHFGEDCPTELRALADRCLAASPADRPAAPEVAYALRTIQKSWGW